MSISRRTLLAAPVAHGVASAAAGAPMHWKGADDPRQSAAGIVKLQADLDPSNTSPWWYEVALYAIVGDAAPNLILRAQGCETYAIRRTADGGYRARGATVTAFKDARNGAWLDTFDNPISGKRNVVRANVISGAAILYPPDGSAPRLDGSAMRPSEIAPARKAASVPQTSSWMQWLESGDQIGCLMERRSTGPVQPYMETASLWANRAEFFDPETRRVDATFTSTFLSPWLAWMDLAGTPGHLMWHSTGRKLRSLAELPAGYRARAERLAPGRLAADPFL